MAPAYEKTYCSQCGQEFGPGDSGYSHCSNHTPKPTMRQLLDAADEALDRDTHDQIQREELDLPDDAEVWITAGTRRKLNALIQALDQQLNAGA